MPPDDALLITWTQEERVLEYREEPVLRWHIAIPVFSGPGERRLNRFYRAVARRWSTHWEKAVFPMACADLDTRRSRSRPFTVWEGQLSGRVELHTGQLVSLCMTARENRAGKRGEVFWGDVWTLPGAVPLSPAQVLSVRRRGRRELREQLSQQGEQLARTGQCLLDADWARKLPRFLHPEDLWLTEKGLCIPFPQGSIAPMAEGTPVFSLPRPAGNPAFLSENST